MQIINCPTLAELNEQVSDLLIREIRQNPQALVCAATGNSPTGIYQKLVEKQSSIVVAGLSFIKLDEWYGLGADDAGSCEYYLNTHLLAPLKVSPDRYIAFDGKTNEPIADCKRVQHLLEEHGPIGLCILGLGQNGHIAFNEPADALQPHAHLAQLSKTSLTHTMIKDTNTEIELGFTLGMADILQSKKIILVVNGTHKHEIMQRLTEEKVSTQLPASFLWLHPDVQCFYCESDN